MKLNLTYSHKLNIRTHESDHEHRGTSYYYEMENKFHTKLLHVENNGEILVTDIFTDISNKYAGWVKEQGSHLALNEAPLSTAKAEADSAENNFNKNALSFQNSCNAAGVSCTFHSRKGRTAYPEDQVNMRISAIISGDLCGTLALLIKHEKTAQLKTWFSAIQINLPRDFTTFSRGQRSKRNISQTSPHIPDFCEDCQKLDRLCSLKMELSRSGAIHHRGDMVIKGLPPAITDEQLREIFSTYGTVSKIKILPPHPDFSSRMAFITFTDPVSALTLFNNPATSSLSFPRKSRSSFAIPSDASVLISTPKPPGKLVGGTEAPLPSPRRDNVPLASNLAVLMPAPKPAGKRSADTESTSNIRRKFCVFS